MVACQQCLQVYVFRGSKTGPSTIFAHTCGSKRAACSSSQNQPRLGTQLKQKLTCAAIYAAITDKLPYSFAEKVGIQHLFQQAVDIASVHGKYSASAALPCHRTVSDGIKKVVDLIEAETKLALKTAVSPSFAVDHCTDSFTSIDYQGISVRFIDFDFKRINEHGLHATEYKYDNACASSLAQSFMDTMAKFGLSDEILADSYCTSDQCRALVNAVNIKSNHVVCGCHNIATVL